MQSPNDSFFKIRSQCFEEKNRGFESGSTKGETVPVAIDRPDYVIGVSRSSRKVPRLKDAPLPRSALNLIAGQAFVGRLMLSRSFLIEPQEAHDFRLASASLPSTRIRPFPLLSQTDQPVEDQTASPLLTQTMYTISATIFLSFISVLYQRSDRMYFTLRDILLVTRYVLDGVVLNGKRVLGNVCGGNRLIMFVV